MCIRDSPIAVDRECGTVTASHKYTCPGVPKTALLTKELRKLISFADGLNPNLIPYQLLQV